MRPVKRFMTTALFAAVAALALPAHAISDEAFLKEAAQSGAAEIEASKLAVTKAKTPEVKKFAESMIADHTKVDGELKALAAAKNVKLPEGPSVKHKTELKLIDTGDNDKFDERYVRSFGVKAHQETIKLFEEGARDAKDPEVKAWATKTLPALKHHLEMAQALPGAKK